MGSRLVDLCFDAEDPPGLARFWAEALRWELGDETGREVGLVPTDGTRFGVRFLPVRTEKLAKNRIHIDLTTTSVADQEGTVEQLTELGARPADIGQGDVSWVVMADPEGNEFCVIEPENAFLADCGRLGSITCDGTPKDGYFWSEALGWPLVWDQDDETAIRHPDGSGPFITWGPPVPQKVGKNRLHLDIAPADDADALTEVDRLAALGATRLETNQAHLDAVAMADPDGNEFFVFTP